MRHVHGDLCALMPVSQRRNGFNEEELRHCHCDLDHLSAQQLWIFGCMGAAYLK
jgi:hypothetical protein